MTKFESLQQFYKGKRVLVTGHTGFKGSWLCLMLRMLGAEVYGYALAAPTEPALFDILKLSEEMHSEIGDIRDFPHLSAFMETARPEVVLHLAAQPIVRTSYLYPRETFETNVMGTVNLLEAIRRYNAQHAEKVQSFLNVTTDKVYENPDLADHAFREDEKLDGYDPYSNSKSCSELVTHSYKNSFFADGRVAISTARAGNVIGGGDFAADRIIPDCVRAAQKGEEIDRPGLAASFTKAVSDRLVPRTMMAAKELGYDKIVVAGGVAANSRIRADFKAAAEKRGYKLYIPPLKLCGDNGAMIGAQAYYEYLAGVRGGSDLNAYATMDL